MFSQAQRLSSKLLKDVLDKGQLFRSNHFSLIVSHSVVEGSKISIWVAKKVTHKATERNRLRRQVRSWFIRESYDTLLQKKTGVIVFINTTWQGSFSPILQKELHQLLLKSSVLV